MADEKKKTWWAGIFFAVAFGIYALFPFPYPPEAELETPLVMGASSAKGGVLQRIRPSSARGENVAPMGLLWPLDAHPPGRRYGWVRSAFDRNRQVFHNGLDAAAPKGTPIRAASAGAVTTARWLGSCGYGVILLHYQMQHQRVTSTYCHLSEIVVARDAQVKRGDVLGLVGSTGASTTPHLHLRIDVDRKHVDPIIHFPDLPKRRGAR